MSGARPGRRAIDGVLLLDKPAGITSHAAVQGVRRLFNTAKAGHTGTLDPMATGLLPVCLGEATKFSHLLLDADKVYAATIRLGMTTSTGDLEGEITSRSQVELTDSRIEEALTPFVGDILQVPPMYSAIKKDGQPLYKLARAGKEIHREPRKIRINNLVMTGRHGDEFAVRVSCSKGTYIRVLAEDIGRVLGCGGCLSALRREAVGAFSLGRPAVTLEQLGQGTLAERDAALLPVDALVASLPRLDLGEAQFRRFSQGQVVEKAPGGLVKGLARVYGPDGRFVGVGEVAGPGCIAPRRLTAQQDG
jgi:tRNA pseudouridine55 synthase